MGNVGLDAIDDINDIDNFKRVAQVHGTGEVATHLQL